MLKCKYTSTPSTSSSSDQANSKLRRPFSQNDLNNIQNMMSVNELSEKNFKQLNYTLYDEHQVKCFTSKRTCILVRTKFIDSQNKNSSDINESNVNANTANNCRHLHQRQFYHQLHQKQLKEFDEELEQSAINSINLINDFNENQMNINNKNINFEETEIKISYACILIGSSPDLDFLPPSILNNLAVTPEKILNTKENPILIDMYTHESTKYPQIYGMGPLIGDNFVRFGTGGALAITKKIVEYIKKERRHTNSNMNLSLSIKNKVRI